MTFPKRAALLVASGLIGAASFPIAFSRDELLPSGVLEPLAFACLIPALVAVRDLSPRRAFGAGFIAGWAFFIGAFWWVTNAMTQFTPLPGVVCAFFMSLLAAWCAVHWGLAFYLLRRFETRNGWAMAWTLVPVWMATELMRNYFMSGFPWANLGYSQARDLWLAQSASVVGVYGIAGGIAFVNAAGYEAVRAWVFKERRFPVRWVASAGALVGVALACGALRVRAWDAKLKRAATVNVAVVQGNIDERIKFVQGQFAGAVLDAYNPPTVAADANGADLVVWPEGAFPLPFPKGTRQWRSAGLGKPSYRASLLIGADIFDPKDLRSSNENAAFLLAPDLSVASTYTKHHLVPFGEYVPFYLDRLLMVKNLVPGTFKPGESLDPLHIATPSGGVSLGTEICFDAIFPEISRAYANAGAQVLVNITNDAWYGFSSAPFQFLRMVQMRAIEVARPVARAANTGISAFIDPIGRITEQTRLGLANAERSGWDAALQEKAEWRMAPLPLVSDVTWYARIGDWPSYLAAAFCVVALFLKRP